MLCYPHYIMTSRVRFQTVSISFQDVMVGNTGLNMSLLFPFRKKWVILGSSLWTLIRELPEEWFVRWTFFSKTIYAWENKRIKIHVHKGKLSRFVRWMLLENTKSWMPKWCCSKWWDMLRFDVYTLQCFPLKAHAGITMDSYYTHSVFVL